MAGVEIPKTFQGTSLTPLFQSAETPWRNDYFHENYEYPGDHRVPRNRGVRTERYKLIEYYEQEPVEYESYDLLNDPKEIHNLYGSIQYVPLIQQLKLRMQVLRTQTGPKTQRTSQQPGVS